MFLENNPVFSAEEQCFLKTWIVSSTKILLLPYYGTYSYAKLVYTQMHIVIIRDAGTAAGTTMRDQDAMTHEDH